MTFAYIHEFQTCFSQTSCLPSSPSFLYLSFISYLIGFNLLFKESTHSYIYIYIYLYLDRIHRFKFISHLIPLLLHSIFFFNIVEISPFLSIQLFRRNFRYLENFNFRHSENSNPPKKNRIAVERKNARVLLLTFRTNVEIFLGKFISR